MKIPTWDLSISYNGLSDEKIFKDIELIEEYIKMLQLHVGKRNTVFTMQNAIQNLESAKKL
ncbi:oligoendopeptidase F protein [Candidatus Photodesmus katoptron Akat1]|uniref:Oligoendopeptidase F protein n=1 Tax=Candidatus Photodesmus katoptron Akat1 TaxID=1236703 RepID=S3DJS2_9GAMM|nr:oligoendopeptidase F protein [Candidatus Photodesmus katoptron Akat1]